MEDRAIAIRCARLPNTPCQPPGEACRKGDMATLAQPQKPHSDKPTSQEFSFWLSCDIRSRIANSTDNSSKQDVQFAERTQVERNKENIEKLLRLIAEPMGWTEAQLSFVFVTDESRLDDFNLADGEIKRISEELGFCVLSADLLIDIALRMSPAN